MRKGIKYICLLSIALLSIVGCTVGLGSSVSYLPPTVGISYPPAGAVIRDSFVIKGEATDDGAIKSVKIELVNTITKQKHTYNGQYDFKTQSWQVTVPNKHKNSPGERTLSDIPDGRYEVLATVTNTSGYTSTAKTVYDIDNTPPLFVLDRPSTVVASANTDAYGAVFRLLGQAADNNDIASITMKVKGIDKTFVRHNPGFNIDIAYAYDETSHDTPYSFFKREQEKNVPKRVEATFILEDKALKYDGKTPAEQTGGNKSQGYYLRSDVVSVLETASLKTIAEYKAGLPATSAFKEAFDKLAAVTMISSNTELSTFTVNERKTPSYSSDLIGGRTVQQLTTLGKGGLPLDSLIVDSATPRITLKPNLDNTPLINSSYTGPRILLREYKTQDEFIKALKDPSQDPYVTAPSNGTVAAPIELYNFETPQINASSVTVSQAGNTYGVTIRLQDFKNSFKIGRVYQLIVEGTDSSKLSTNKYEPVNANGQFADVDDHPYVLAFTAAQNTGVPRVKVKRLVSPYARDSITIPFTVSSDSQIQRVEWEYTPSGGQSAKREIVAGSPLMGQTSTSGNEELDGSITIESSSFGKLPEGENWVSIIIGNGSGSGYGDIRFVKDTTKPSINIESRFLNDVLTGSVTVIGTLADTNGSGIKTSSIKALIGKNKRELTGNVVSATTTSWTLSFRDAGGISQFGSNEFGTETESGSGIYNVPLTIEVSDNVGNEESKQFTLQIDPSGERVITEIIVPESGKTVGGRVQVSGSAMVKNQNLGVRVAAVELQISGNTPSGSMTNAADVDAFFNQSWSDNDGKQWAGTGVAQATQGSIAWNTVIEAEKFIPSGQQTTKIYLRARGKNSNGVSGPWSKPIDLTLDRGVPRIADAKINNRPYEYGTWISGDDNRFEVALYDEESGLKRIQMQANFTFDLGGTQVSSVTWELPNGENNKAISGNHFDQYFEIDTARNPSASTGAKNYKLKANAFKIPSKTKDLTQAQITFTVVEAKSENALSTTSTFTLRCDNTSPLGDFGDVLWSGVASFDGTTITDTNAFAGYPLASSAKIGDKLFVQGKSLDITSVDTGNHTITVRESDITGSGIGAVLYRQNIYIYGSDYVVQGFCIDTGAGIAPTGITANIDGQNMGTVSLSGLYGSYFKWSGTLNSSSVNGQKSLVVKFTDVLGNTQTKTYNVAVKNTPFKVTQVQYKTDVNQNGSFADNTGVGLSEIEAVSSFTSNAYDATHSYTNVLSNIGFVFTSANKSEIVVTTDGGTPGKYELKLNGSNTVIKSGTSWPSGGIIPLNSTELNKIGATGVATLTIWESDKPEGYGEWYTQVAIPMATALVDTKKPAIFALPFYWNAINDNSLKNNSASHGHIEIRGGNQAPQISGEVVLKGSAYDDRLLKKLVIKIKKNSSEKATFTATYNKSNGNWSVQPTSATAGATLTVTTKALTTKGHFAEWSLAWNSASTDVGSYTVEAVATDDNNKQSSDNGSVPSAVAVTRHNNKGLRTASEILRGQVVNLVSGTVDQTRDVAYYRNISGGSSLSGYTFESTVDETYNQAIIYPVDYSKASFAVEIVPYINKITVNDSGNEQLYWRTLQGHYPARADKSLTISGFNLNSATYTIGNKSFTNTSGMPDKSGAVVATVNGTTSINNTNNNVKLYNQIAGNQINGKTTDNDDMVVDVWEFSPDGKLITSADTGIESIQMAINPSDGMVGIGYLNGSHLVNGPTKTASSRTAENNFDSFNGHAFVYKNDGETWSVVQGADMNPAGSGSGGFVNLLNNSSYSTDDIRQNYQGGGQHYHIDQIAVVAYEGSGYEILKQRYKGFSFALAGNSTVYLAYYDSIFDQIKMRTFASYPNTNSPNSTGTVSKDNGGYSVIAGAFKQLKIKDSTKDQYVVASTDRGAGEYLSLQAVGTNNLAITWYNAKTNELWYAYTNNLNNATATVDTSGSGNANDNKNVEVIGKNKSGWTAKKLADGGKYCKMIVANASGKNGVSSADDTAKIYIAYQTDNLKLGFIELAAYNQTTPTRKIVIDDYQITAQHLSLAQNKDNLPVIGYFATWEQKARYAYPIGNDTSAWDVTVVPSQYRIGEDNIGIAGYHSGQMSSKDKITIEGLEHINVLPSSSSKETKIYGNNSGNSILGYIAIASGRQTIELAQMR